MGNKATADRTLELADIGALAAPARTALLAAVSALRRDDLVRAERELTISLVHAPQHAEPHRLLGLLLQRRGRPELAAESFRSALAARPDDAAILRSLTLAQADAADFPAALAGAERLCALAPVAASFALLADLRERHGEIDAALAASERALALDPNDTTTQLRRGRCLFQVGRLDDAAAQFRAVLAGKRQRPAAWHGLAELRRTKFDAADRAAIERDLGAPGLRDIERAILQHVRGRACEDLGDYAAAFAAFSGAAGLERRYETWDAAAFERYLAGVQAAFPQPLDVRDDFGAEAIFIVGLPRSGSTLIEQVLAAHREVEGASELPDLNAVIEQETRRQQAPPAQWAGRIGTADWRRLGAQYLARTARWRESTPRFCDKMPGNWVYAEAALAMLPGARIVFSARDPLETCWSCFKQFFAPGLVPWSHRFEHLAHYWRLCQAQAERLAARYPSRVRIQSYEALLDDPDAEIAALLAFCGLASDPACLRPHELRRTVRSASAGQVLAPLGRRASSAAPYAAWLEPLREALGGSALPQAALGGEVE